jgi:hypothetical protein
VLENDPVALALAPAVSDAVGVRERDRESDAVLEGVSAAVGVAELVSLPVGVLEGVASADTVELRDGDGDDEPVSVDDGVPLAVAPADSVVVGVADGVDEMLAVVDAVSVLDGVWLSVAAAVRDALSVVEGVGVGVAPALAVVEPAPLSDPVALALAPGDSVAADDGGAEGGADADRIGSLENLLVGAAVGVGVGGLEGHARVAKRARGGVAGKGGRRAVANGRVQGGPAHGGGRGGRARHQRARRALGALPMAGYKPRLFTPFKNESHGNGRSFPREKRYAPQGGPGGEESPGLRQAYSRNHSFGQNRYA